MICQGFGYEPLGRAGNKEKNIYIFRIHHVGPLT